MRFVDGLVAANLVSFSVYGVIMYSEVAVWWRLMDALVHRPNVNRRCSFSKSLYQNDDKLFIFKKAIFPDLHVVSWMN